MCQAHINTEDAGVKKTDKISALMKLVSILLGGRIRRNQKSKLYSVLGDRAMETEGESERVN